MWILVLTVLSAAVYTVTPAISLEKTVCEGQLDTISCQTGLIIQIDNVLYGRTSNTPCNAGGATFTNLQCVSTQKSTDAVTRNCQARTTCLLQADNNFLGEDPCPGKPKYLKVRYQCVLTVGPQVSTSQSNPKTTPSNPPTTPPTTPPSTTSVTRSLGSGASQPNISGSQRKAQLCHEYLVSGTRGVPDGQLSASSQLAINNNVHRGRLHTGITKYPNGYTLEGAWTAAAGDKNPWIQVKMNWLTMVTGIVTQGRHVNPSTNCCQEWVTQYKVAYSLDGSQWTTVKDKNGADKIFAGNRDSDTPVTQMLDCPVVARFIRVQVVNYSGNASMRLELIGCPTNAGDLGTCPIGWTERPGSNTCYYFSNDRKSWENAYLQCKRNQGDIVKIESQQEKAWLKGEIQASSQKAATWWIGLNNRPRFDNKNYKWDDGTSLNTNAIQWLPGEPNNSGGQEHCAAYVTSRDALNDYKCSIQMPFICKKSKYWTKPVNVPGLVTIKPTLPPTKAPATVNIKIPVPSGGNAVTSGPNFFATGCVKTGDCAGRAWGDYQSCNGCGFYLTCAPFGPVVRKCPFNTKYDDNDDACKAKSSTCRGP